MPAAAATFTVNGVAVTAAPDAVLLDVLRGPLGLRSPKDGCRPQGQCGCCTVLVDGEPRIACVTPARRVAGRSVVTLEGLPADVRARWGAAFAGAHALQCGFCTPGIVARLVSLAARQLDADPARLDRALAAHVCRCTGWSPIRDAFFARSAPAGPDTANLAELALGERPFIADLACGAGPVAHLRVVRAGATGRIGAITPGAPAGVLCLTAAEAPAFLAAPGDPCVPGTPVLAFAGEADLVRAASPRVAVTPVLAAAPARVWTEPEPLLDDAGLRLTLELDAADHASLEPPTWFADGTSLWTSSAAPAQERAWLTALGLDVAVTRVAAGGAFGGRDPLPDGVLAVLAADRLGRPVLAAVDRTAAIVAAPKRRRWRVAASATLSAAGLALTWRARVDAAPGPGVDPVHARALHALRGLPYRGMAGGHLDAGHDSPFPGGGYRAEGWLPVALAAEVLLDRLLDDPVAGRLDLLTDPLAGAALHALVLPDAAGWAVACVAPQLPRARVEVRVERTADGPVVVVPVGETGQGAHRLLERVLGGRARVVADPRAGAAPPGCGPALAAAVAVLDLAAAPVVVDVELPPPAPAAAAVRLEGDKLAEVRVAIAAGPLVDSEGAHARAAGAAHMGLGAALSEGVEVREDGTVRSTTLRHLGVIRAADTPPIDVRFTTGGPARGVGASAFAAACCAAAVAIARLDPGAPLRLPARDSPPGRRLRSGT